MKKLKRTLQYLRKNRHLYLTLEGSDLRIIKWWVDASFAVHPGHEEPHRGNNVPWEGNHIFHIQTTLEVPQKLNWWALMT
jgi:hypothetical protein